MSGQELERIQGDMARRMAAAADQTRLMVKLGVQASDSLVPRQQKDLALALIEANNVSRMLTLDLRTVLNELSALRAQLQQAQARAEAAEKGTKRTLQDLAEWMEEAAIWSEKYVDTPSGARAYRDAKSKVLELAALAGGG